MISAVESLSKLQQGNKRFINNARDMNTLNSQARRAELVDGQKPAAIILGCSDSRVPAELVFDQGFGDIFVIRVAGNVATPTQIGSVEYAVQQFDTPLVVVLGHTGCGAVKATLQQLEESDSALSPSLSSIVDRIKPAVATLLESPLKDDAPALEAACIRANVCMAANHLRHESKILAERVASEQLLIVGAEYSLESGVVEFFDGLPST